MAFYDDALLMNAKDHLGPILRQLIARGVHVRLHAPNGLHARLVTPELARLLREAGFVTLRLGLETVDPEISHRDGDKVSMTHLRQAVEALFDAGFAASDIGAYVLIARPGQTPESVYQTVAFAHGLGIPVLTAQFSPIPGTAEWEAAVDAGLLPRDADPLLHNKSSFPCGNASMWEAVKVRVREGNRRILTKH